MEKTVEKLLTERFGRDSLIALATQECGVPSVRAVNALYEGGAFYCITDARSNKMRQIAKNSTVGLCGEWFTGHGRGENLGWIGAKENEVIAEKLRKAFASWLGNGHVNEADENTVILKVTLTDGVLMSHGTRYEF